MEVEEELEEVEDTQTTVVARSKMASWAPAVGTE